MSDLRGRRLGSYLLLERIGRGGMSSVFSAQPQRGDEVAVKVLELDPEQEESAVFYNRFRREAHIISELKHPHILPLLDYGQEGMYIYFVMPLIRGGTLADVIRKQGLVPPEAACHWLTQIASALDHAHRFSVVHRDLKPSNVLLDEGGNAYLTDFGIAKFSNMTDSLTQTGNVVGTPAYMAPEQWRGEQLDGRTDVYGLGVMAYLMLTGHTPFEATSAHTLMYQHLDAKPPSPRIYQANLPAELENVLFMALAKKPAQRYSTAGNFASDFCLAVNGKETYALKTQIPVRASHPAPKAVTYTPPAPVPSVPAVHPPAVLSAQAGGQPLPYYPIPENLRRRRAHIMGRNAGLALSVGFAALGFLVLVLFLLLARDSFLAERPTPEPAFTASPDPNPPRIQIESPPQNGFARQGEFITIRAVAYDTQGVTRVELRRDGVVLDERSAPQSEANGLSPFNADFVYMPEQAGKNILELIAYRGEVAGLPEYLTLEVGTP